MYYLNNKIFYTGFYIFEYSSSLFIIPLCTGYHVLEDTEWIYKCKYYCEHWALTKQIQNWLIEIAWVRPRDVTCKVWAKTDFNKGV